MPLPFIPPQKDGTAQILPFFHPSFQQRGERDDICNAKVEALPCHGVDSMSSITHQHRAIAYIGSGMFGTKVEGEARGAYICD
jgi:hypothetical protein